jgi:hypothetical protein
MVFSVNKDIVDEVEKQAQASHVHPLSKLIQQLLKFFAFNQQLCAKLMSENSGIMVLIDVWPFLPEIFENKTRARSAWPPRLDPSKKVKSFFPVLAYFQWEDEKSDDFWVGQMQTALNYIHEVAKKTKATTPDAPMYSNTSLETVKAQEVYREALAWLSQVRQRYDPKDVMSLTGGFKIPLN